MATRPVFVAETAGLARVRVETVDFTWHAGMSYSRKQMTMRSLHEAAQTLHPEARILEVSRMSDEPLGEQLSAFNLPLTPRADGREISVECAFQASKIFERGGPFLDLLGVSSVDAKRDPRLKESGLLVGFEFFGQSWPNEPPTAFYDWIYVNALHRQPELSKAVMDYDIFTDIAFNPKKSINCQASAVALYVAMVRRGELEAALSSREEFLQVETDASIKDDNFTVQGTLF